MSSWGFIILLVDELHLPITRVCTCRDLLSKRSRFIPLQLSSCNLTPKFLHGLRQSCREIHFRAYRYVWLLTLSEVFESMTDIRVPKFSMS